MSRRPILTTVAAGGIGGTGAQALALPSKGLSNSPSNSAALPAIAATLAAGATYRDLGEALDLSPDAARMRARRAGLRSRRKGRPPHPEGARRLHIARQMKAQGYEAEAIGERLGMSAGAVRMMLRRAKA